MPHAVLGDVVSTHRVDDARRRTIAAWSLGVGVAAVVFVLVIGFEPSSVLDFVVLVAGTMLTVCVFTTAQIVRGGPEEVFVVHADGLAYTNRFGTRRWRWEELGHIRVRRPRFPGLGGEFLGGQLTAVIRPRTGRSVRFTGLTLGHEELVAAVRAHTDPVPPITVRDRLRWLGLTAGSLIMIVLLFLYMSVIQRVNASAGRALVETGLGATTVVVVVGGTFFCLMTAVIGVVKAARRR